MYKFFIKYILHVFVISPRKNSSPVKKYKIFNIFYFYLFLFFTGLDETSSCFSAVQIL